MPFSRCFYALPTEPPRTTIYTRFTEAHGQTLIMYASHTDSSAQSETRHPTHTYKEDTHFNVILVADLKGISPKDHTAELV
jgi:hypothetical protein